MRGALDEFLEKTAFKDAVRSDALLEIAAGVASYHEEGVPLFPEVYCCQDANQFMKFAPGSKFYVLGSAIAPKQAAITALKKCAPLTSRYWDILIEFSGTDCRFGVLQRPSAATALTLENSYFGASNSELPAAMRIASPRPQVVSFQSACGARMTVSFTHDEIVISDLISPSEKLANAIVARVEDAALRNATKAFLTKVLTFALRGSHGCLVGVVSNKWVNKKELPVFLQDSVRVDPMIDLPAAISRIKAKDIDQESVCSPLTYFDLIRGMLSVDGITVFSNDGKLLAYNAFVYAPYPKARRDEIQGARKRAFSVLETAVKKKQMTAAFYQSQDGKTIFKEA